VGRLKDIQRAVYVLAGSGALIFLSACVLHSKAIGVVGIGLMVTAVLLSLPIYLAEMTTRTRALGLISVAWAILFAIWLVAATAFPAVRRAPLPLFIVGAVFGAGSLMLAFAWWRSERVPSNGQRNGTHKGRSRKARH
jgi:hypothetical protein